MTLVLPRDRPVDTERVGATVARWLATDFHRTGWRESPYRGITQRVVVEDFLGDGVTPPPDHKLYMFHGRLGLVQVDEGRFGRHTSALLDPGWNVLDVDQAVPRPDSAPTPPPAWAEMVSVAETLSADFPMARIDLYDIDGRVYFGEITHFPGGGVATYRPPAFNRAVGDLWRHGTPIPAALRLS